MQEYVRPLHAPLPVTTLYPDRGSKLHARWQAWLGLLEIATSHATLLFAGSSFTFLIAGSKLKE